VVFIPAAISPHKLESRPTPAAIRWEMVQASLADEPGLVGDDLELHRAGPSFTYDTVATYRERYPTAELFYFIGYDNLAKLQTWHRIGELQDLATFIVLERGEAETGHHFPKIARRFDLSASEIRKRVANGLSIRYLVTPPVDDLIHRHHLYHDTSY
jgi:nicotinate-nucleotide adenylyltransferase